MHHVYDGAEVSPGELRCGLFKRVLVVEMNDDEPRLPWQWQHQLKMRLDELT